MAAETASKVAHLVVKSVASTKLMRWHRRWLFALSLDEGGCQAGIEEGSSLRAMLGLDEGSEDVIKDGCRDFIKDGCRDGIKDGSTLGDMLSLDKGSEDSCEDGCSDSNKDGCCLVSSLAWTKGLKTASSMAAETASKIARTLVSSLASAKCL
jgi:hypothetical protein